MRSWRQAGTTDLRDVDEAKPLVSIVAGNSAERTARALQALRRILPHAPRGAVLATDGRRYGILPHPDNGWYECCVNKESENVSDPR